MALLDGAGIETVVDVRRYPGSRRNPQFGREALAGALAEAGIGYRWVPALGGRRSPAFGSPHVALRNASFRAYADHMGTAQFAAALDGLLQDALREPTAVLCAESVWWRCHRRLIADAATLVRGFEVQHLLHDGRIQAHPPSAGARVAGQRLVYDGGQDRGRSGV